MISLKIGLASTACFALMACQVGVGTPGHCVQNPASCSATSPNQLTESSLKELSTRAVSGSTKTKSTLKLAETDSTAANDANALVQLLSLSAPKNFRIVERSNGTLRTVWNSTEKSPHTYTLYLNGKSVAEGVSLSSYTFTGLDDAENYELAIEAFSPDGKSPRVKISAFDTVSSEANNSDSGGSGSGGSGSGGSGSGGSGSGGSGSGGSGSGGSGSGGSDSGGSGSGDSSDCPQGSLVSVCVGVGGIGLGLGI